MLDDEILGAALRETGKSFAVPLRGAADILQRIHGGDDTRAGADQAAGGPDDHGDHGDHGDPEDGDAPVSPTWRGTIRAHRLLSVAAALLLLAVVAGAALWGTTTPTARTAAGPGALSHEPAHGPEKTSSGASSPAGVGSSAAGSPDGTSAQSSAASAPAAAPGSTTPAQGTGSTGSTTPALPPGEVGQSARIEQTGSLDLTVAKGSLSATIGKLSSLAARYDGFVANLQTQSGGTGGGPPTGTITLQIPVASFSSALADAQSLGKASQLSTKATDVTGQYVDLQDQITSLEASRQQYLTIMTRASSIGDVLAVQAQLNSLQSQIQQLQGQLQVLSSETAYSTLTVTASEAGPVHHPPVPVGSSSLAKAWHASVHGFIVGMEGLVRIAGPVLFVVLCLGALVIGGRLSWRRLQRRNL
jgi:Domain of unknown function (DUF4349)